ncbi:hypothetical protein [Coralloluteibacterium thermophilus]|uniref:Uncharacterized protein n=1 Tax=Coralloluteibacterium thermophilum TaxID=2707049 RepID=A0ABV9NJK3_9GAMM
MSPTLPSQAAARKLRLAGAVLVVVALVNIGFALALPPAGRSPVPGILVELVGAALGLWLLRRSLAGARAATWYAAFGIGFGIAVFAVLLPVLKPPAVWIDALRTDFAVDGVPLLRGLAHLVLLGVVYRLLRSAPVRQARTAAGLPDTLPWPAFLLGAGLACVVALAIALGR